MKHPLAPVAFPLIIVLISLVLGFQLPRSVVKHEMRSASGETSVALTTISVSEELSQILPGSEELLLYLAGQVYTNQDFGIATYVAASDADGDGVDDQTDLLQSALAYVATEPVYKSEYYVGGYGTGEYGVCTDVIAYGFLGAGYDLMEMLNQDEAVHEALYPAAVDPYIDFRRVENVNVFLSRYAAESLTTDIYDLAAWQPGDIVVFEEHIAFISDIRNSNGIPYLVHHPEEGEYIEDCLERLSYAIIGHYRWK